MIYPHIERRNGELFMEQASLRLIAERFGTPCYVYSRAALNDAWHSYDQAFGARRHRIHYAVKANANLAVLDTLARLGSGFDIVSAGELARVLAVGGVPERIVFSGVGKTAAEMRAAIAAGIGVFNVESPAELERLNDIAGSLSQVARVAIRVNPDVDAQTHPYISTGLTDNKFGVPMPEALALYRRAASLSHLKVAGIACHIGSQITALAPFIDALARVMALVAQLAQEGIEIAHVDAGGGLGIRYQDETPPPVADYVAALCRAIPERYEICIEPGRSICGPAGVLLTRVEYLKDTPTRRFAICDAAMTELIRPALYEAWHAVEVVQTPPASVTAHVYDLVGPVCESADFLATGRHLPLETHALLSIMSAGAYGHVMASNYNARPRPPELVVDGEKVHLARPRETLAALFAEEQLLPTDSP